MGKLKERSPSSPAATPASASPRRKPSLSKALTSSSPGGDRPSWTAVAYIGDNVTAVQGDVSKPEDLDRLYSQVKHEKGKIDILFANAGIGGRARLGEITDKHIDDLLSINIKGVILTVQKARPLLARGASIILNARRAVNLLRPEARSRINGLFVGLFFIGGALGSAATGLAWSIGGWLAVCGLCASFAALALLVDWLGWRLSRRECPALMNACPTSAPTNIV